MIDFLKKMLTGVSGRILRRRYRTGELYDAFISYSHEHDGAFAPALQTALERYAKPWYRMRALRLFRDDADLAANPALWRSIEQALGSSASFVLLASEQAAQSPWVDREVAWWLARRTPERMLIAATSPGLTWDERHNDWASGAPVPPSLRGVLGEEPRRVDLAGVRDADRWSTIPDELLADLAAPLHGVEKDELRNAHKRQHRRTLRHAGAAIMALAVLLAASVVAASIAVVQRDDAVRLGRVTLAHQLAATSATQLGSNLQAALLLAVQAYRTNPDPQTLAALMQADTFSPYLVRFKPMGGDVTYLAGSGNGRFVVVGLADGRVFRWQVARSDPILICKLHDAVTSLAVSSSGTVVVASDGSSARLWRSGHGTRVLSVPAGQRADLVALSPSGLTAVVQGFTSNSPGVSVTVFRVSGAAAKSVHPGPGPRISLIGEWFEMVLPSDREVVLEDVEGYWERRRLPDWSLLESGRADGLGAHTSPGTPAADGRYLTATSLSGIFPVSTTARRPPFGQAHLTATAPISAFVGPDAVALSPDGTRLAVADSGDIFVAPVGKAGASRSQAIDLTGSGSVSTLAFLGSDTELASASGDQVVLWNLRQVDRLARSTQINLGNNCPQCVPPAIEISPDGTLAAIVGDNSGTAMIQPLSSAAGRARVAPLGDYLYGPPAWDGNSRVLLPVFPSSGEATVTPPTTAATIFRIWDGGIGSGAIVAAAATAKGTTEILVDGQGQTYIEDTQTGTVRKKIPRPAGLSADSGGDAAVRIAPDLVAVNDSRSVTIVNADTGHPVGRVPSRGGSYLTFSGSHLLVQRADGSLEVWTDRGTARQRIIAGTLNNGQAVGNSQGTVVAIPQINGPLDLYDLTSGTLLDTIPPLLDSASGAIGVAFAPNGRQLVTVTSLTNGYSEMVVRDISGHALVQAACRTAARSLSTAEWQSFVGSTTPAHLACQ